MATRGVIDKQPDPYLVRTAKTEYSAFDTTGAQGGTKLSELSSVYIQQIHMCCEGFGMERNNRYILRNDFGDELYKIEEHSSTLNRYCAKQYRAFNMIMTRVSDGTQVLEISRPKRNACPCCPCQLQRLTVEMPKGVNVGAVVQQRHYCEFAFTIEDCQGVVLYTISRTNICHCNDLEFHICTTDGTVAGKIIKKFTTWFKECCTNAHEFDIQFPPGCSEQVKATLIGAVILFDFMFFEKQD